MYKLLVDNIPEGTNASKGVYINNLINLEPQEEVIAINSFERKTDAKYVIFITKKGQFKKTLIEEYKSVKKTTGIIAIKLNEGDSIANVVFANEEEFIIITENGMSIRFETKDIAAIGRNAAGVKSIKLDEDDNVLTGFPIANKTEQVAIIAENGLGKKVKLDEFPLQGRAGKGVYVYKGSKVKGAELVSDEDNLLIIGKPNSICISATDLPTLSRISTGNQMIKDAKVQSVTKI
jgi:DNA gyrase subunit A